MDWYTYALTGLEVNLLRAKQRLAGVSSYVVLARRTRGFVDAQQARHIRVAIGEGRRTISRMLAVGVDNGSY